VGRVWPVVRARVPDATFAILGADPPAEITAWHGQSGITVTANPEDLRPEVGQRDVVVLPFVSGGGIKNKFLEAASMSRPIVATTRATRGLRSAPPVSIADAPAAFASAIVDLWASPDRGAAAGRAARAWVREAHTWQATASEAARLIGMR
jgi:glycosyltransferase involved in cell wall biosynthesis